MKRPELLTIVLLLIILCHSCTWNSEEELYPEVCDTTNVTFNLNIKPILTANCYACHSNANADILANGIHLEDYEDVKLRANAISGAINRTGSFPPMPKNAAKLRPCLISQYDKWLEEGALNN